MVRWHSSSMLHFPCAHTCTHCSKSSLLLAHPKEELNNSPLDRGRACAAQVRGREKGTASSLAHIQPQRKQIADQRPLCRPTHPLWHAAKRLRPTARGGREICWRAIQRAPPGPLRPPAGGRADDGREGEGDGRMCCFVSLRNQPASCSETPCRVASYCIWWDPIFAVGSVPCLSLCCMQV